MKNIKSINLVEGIILIAAIGGIAGPLAKYALQDIPVFGYTFIRLLAGVLVMLIALYTTRQRPTLKKFISFAPVATLWWLNALIFTAGLEGTTATTAQFIHICIPATTALVAFIILKEKLNTRQWTGSLIAITGVGLVVISSGSVSFESHTMIGNLLILLSAIIFSFYAVLSKKNNFSNISPVEMILIASLCGALANLPMALLEYRTNHWIAPASPLSLLAMLGAVISISIFYIGFQALIRKFGPSAATTNLYILPISVVFWSFIILKDIPSPQTIAGAIITIIGILIFSVSPAKQGANLKK